MTAPVTFLYGYNNINENVEEKLYFPYSGLFSVVKAEFISDCKHEPPR